MPAHCQAHVWTSGLRAHHAMQRPTRAVKACSTTRDNPLCALGAGPCNLIHLLQVAIIRATRVRAPPPAAAGARRGRPVTGWRAGPPLPPVPPRDTSTRIKQVSGCMRTGLSTAAEQMLPHCSDSPFGGMNKVNRRAGVRDMTKTVKAVPKSRRSITADAQHCGVSSGTAAAVAAMHTRALGGAGQL